MKRSATSGPKTKRDPEPRTGRRPFPSQRNKCRPSGAQPIGGPPTGDSRPDQQPSGLHPRLPSAPPFGRRTTTAATPAQTMPPAIHELRDVLRCGSPEVVYFVVRLCGDMRMIAHAHINGVCKGIWRFFSQTAMGVKFQPALLVDEDCGQKMAAAMRIGLPLKRPNVIFSFALAIQESRLTCPDRAGIEHTETETLRQFPGEVFREPSGAFQFV